MNALTPENYLTKAFRFRERQAGVSVIFDPEDEVFTYNAYCLELELVKELFTVEFDVLDEALDLINNEFGTWDLKDFVPPSGCGSCVAK